MAKKLRIYELAKEHKKSTKEMLSLLKDEFGLKIKSHMSVLSGDELAIVEEYFGEDKKIKEEAEKILQAKGVNYTNLAVKPSEEIDAYLKNLTAFPTNLLINREGKVVGDVSVGSVDDKDKKAELMKKIDEIIANEGK